MTTAARIGLLVAIGSVLLAPIAARVARKRFDPFEPIVLIVLAYGVMFVVRPAAMLVGHHLAYNGPRTSTNVSGTFTKMLLVALVGAVGLVTGYETTPGRRLAKRCSELGRLDRQRIVVAFLVVGVLCVATFAGLLIAAPHDSGLSLIFRGRTAELSREVQGSTYYLWNAFYLLVPVAFVLTAVGLIRRRRLLVVAGVLFGGAFLLRTLPLGDRIGLLPFLGGAFVLYYLRRSKRPTATVVLALIVLALLGSAFLSDLRGRSSRHETVAQTVVRAVTPGRIISPLVSGPDSEMAPVLAAALSVIPSKLGYTYGATIFGDLISRPIPRPLWSAKPELPRDKLIASLWPVEYRKAAVNPEFSVLLYFFWDFGIPGVLVGMLLFGIGARALYEYFLRDRSSLAMQVFYALALWFVVIGLRNSPVDTLIQFAFVVFPVWLAVRVPAWGAVRVTAAVSR